MIRIVLFTISDFVFVLAFYLLLLLWHHVLSPVPIKGIQRARHGYLDVDFGKPTALGARRPSTRSVEAKQLVHVTFVNLIILFSFIVSILNTMADIMELIYGAGSGSAFAKSKELILDIGAIRDGILCLVFAWFTWHFWKRGGALLGLQRSNNAGVSEYTHRTMTRLLYIAIAGLLSFLFLNVRNMLITRKFIAGNPAAVLTLMAVEHVAMIVRSAAFLLILSIPINSSPSRSRFSSDAETGSALWGKLQGSNHTEVISRGYDEIAWKVSPGSESDTSPSSSPSE